MTRWLAAILILIGMLILAAGASEHSLAIFVSGFPPVIVGGLIAVLDRSRW